MPENKQKTLILDTRGLRCPLPVIRLETRMRLLQNDEIIRIFADDPIAAVDIPLAARKAGFTCKRLETDIDSECVFEVTRDL